MLFSFSTVAQIVFPERELWSTYHSEVDSSKRVEVLIKLSTFYGDDKIMSEQLAQRAIKLAKAYGSKRVQALALSHLSGIYFDHSKYQESEQISEELLAKAKELNDPEIFSNAYRLIGRRFHFKGNYSSALENYLKSLDYFERKRDTVQICELYSIIGGIYINQKELKKAEDYFERVLRLQKIRKDEGGQGRAYLNISNVYILNHQLKRARAGLDSSLKYYQLSRNEEGLALVYATLPDIYIELNQQDSALFYLLKSHQYLKALNKAYVITQIDLTIAKILMERKNYGEALVYINEGIDFGLSTQQNHNLASLYLTKSELLDQQGKTKEAFANFKLYKSYSDSVLNAASIRKQTEDALKYDYSKKEYLAELERQKEQVAEHDKQIKQRILAVSIICGAFVIAFVFYVRYRTKKKANLQLEEVNVKLEEQNTIIEEKSKALQKSLAERELLLKEIHHRVKNNLTTLKSLFYLQAKSSDKEEVKLALEECQLRIQSMALIHQSLYEENENEHVEFQHFLTQLFNELELSIKPADKEIEIEYKCMDVQVEMSTALFLGMIVNELATNSFKYAFKDRSEGKVGVILNGYADRLELIYYDDGIGLNEGYDLNKGGFGMKLIRILTGQINASINYSNENHLSKFIIEIPYAK